MARRNRRDKLSRKISAPPRPRSVVDIDPEDPAQTLDDLGGFDIEPLEVEARSEADISEELDLASAENVEGESEPIAGEQEAGPHRDTGELYGVRIPHASDTELAAPEDRDSFEGAERGETFFESLEEHAAEMGPQPEEEVVIVDDSDSEHPTHHPSDWRDRPVADKGSGGPGGL
jgi:hypothetical protein